MSAERMIYKYTLGIGDRLDVAMPRGARILSCGEQHGDVVLWVQVDPTAPIEPRRVAQVVTGGPVPEWMWFVGTVQLGLGRRPDQFVVHIYADRGRQNAFDPATTEQGATDVG